MHFPVAIHFGEFKILLHAVMEPLAFFVGFRYFLYLKKKRSDAISTDNRTWIIIAVIFGAVIGSRLVGGLEDPGKLNKASNMLLYFYANKTILGGLLGGLFAVEAMKRVIGERKASGDLFVYPIILAMIIGRIGCFSMGVFEETYGITTSSFLGMDLGDDLYRHPVALYEIVFLLLLWIGLQIMEKRFLLSNGALFKLFMIAYLVFRFCLDFMKPVYEYSIGLSAIQVTTIVGLIWYIRYILNPKRLLQTSIATSTKAYA
jgi:phosphatidylglycerol---prolipoprotein diacylglyceryl transferase